MQSESTAQVRQDGLLYLVHSGQITFTKSSLPVCVLGLLVPNDRSKALANTVIELRARITGAPFGPIRWNEVCKNLPGKALAISTDKSTFEPLSPPEQSERLVSEILSALKKFGARLFACAAWPHQMLMDMKNLQKQEDNVSREKLVWRGAAQMILQRAHMYLKDSDAYASVLVDQMSPTLYPDTFELLTAPRYDPFINYRRYADTLAVSQALWSAPMQCAQMLAELTSSIFQSKPAAKRILPQIAPLWHRNPGTGELMQCGLISNPAEELLIKELEALGFV